MQDGHGHTAQLWSCSMDLAMDMHGCRNANKKFSPASLVFRQFTTLSPAPAFQHYGQSGTASHRPVRQCPAMPPRPSDQVLASYETNTQASVVSHSPSPATCLLEETIFVKLIEKSKFGRKSPFFGNCSQIFNICNTLYSLITISKSFVPFVWTVQIFSHTYLRRRTPVSPLRLSDRNILRILPFNILNMLLRYATISTSSSNFIDILDIKYLVQCTNTDQKVFPSF